MKQMQQSEDEQRQVTRLFPSPTIRAVPRLDEPVTRKPDDRKKEKDDA